ncbi:Imm63 family immunity protein [Streptomyces sp. TLI_146]|uniref:Imm63 family immunity protein n=1 Tax=Streptomyces sp. TLI_146 TaxID=1938858 RepID=UPI000C6FD916|nr:Imm63 family immunity protein [Streptomyces sp. TLI_146]PKV82906.1 immunity protein 63 of polymorphic toxin system [Streptomyces sp. TLI_146]
MTITEAEISAAHRELARALVGHDVYPVEFGAAGEGHPFVRVEDGVIHRFLMDRGQQHDLGTYTDLDEFMYVVAEEATSSIARRWELGQRHKWPEGRDSRIGWVAKQLQLLSTLNPVWAQRFRFTVETRFPGLSLADVDEHPVNESLISRLTPWRVGRGRHR